MMSDFFEGPSFLALAREVAQLVTRKNKAYGSAYDLSEAFMRLLYPRGIPVEAYGSALTFLRLFDKMLRIATDPKAFGEDPEQDLVGYTLLNLRRARKVKRILKMAGVPAPPTSEVTTQRTTPRPRYRPRRRP